MKKKILIRILAICSIQWRADLLIFIRMRLVKLSNQLPSYLTNIAYANSNTLIWSKKN